MLKGQLFIKGGLAAWAMLHCFVLQAQDLDKAAKALGLIAQFADSICAKIPLEGESSSVELTGGAKVEVSKLLKALTDLNIEGAGKYEKGQYKNVLQKDLATVLKDSSTCKQSVFDSLKDKLLPATPAQATVYPKWGESNFYSGGPPRSPDEMAAYRQTVTATKSGCARCAVQTDRTQMLPPGGSPGFTLAQLAPGSHLAIDTTRCTHGIRYQLTTQQLRVISGAPPAIGALFAFVDVQPGLTTNIELGGQHAFTAEPVQCL